MLPRKWEANTYLGIIFTWKDSSLSSSSDLARNVLSKNYSNMCSPLIFELISLATNQFLNNISNEKLYNYKDLLSLFYSPVEIVRTTFNPIPLDVATGLLRHFFWLFLYIFGNSLSAHRPPCGQHDSASWVAGHLLRSASLNPHILPVIRVSNVLKRICCDSAVSVLRRCHNICTFGSVLEN